MKIILRLLRGLVPGLDAAHDPHVPARTLRSLRCGDPRHEPARYASESFSRGWRGIERALGAARDPHVPARTLRSLRCGVLTVLVLALLTGCGFQLRGQSDLPPEMSTTRLVVPDRTGEFARELELLLRGNGVKLVDESGPDVAELRILDDRITRRALTISGTARVREFLLTFELRFALIGPDGEPMLGPETLRQERDFQFDEQEILGAATEEERIREELHRTMAAALLRRLEAFGRQ